jgi:hypothetical protein
VTLILQFLNYRVAGVVPCTENIPEDEVTVHSRDHAWIYNDHFNESETGQIGNLGWSLDPYIKCKFMHILRILCRLKTFQLAQLRIVERSLLPALWVWERSY